MIKENKNEDKRIGYVDIFRGIGIIFMVLGHIGLGKGFHHYIHAFHMPMFFFIAGFCYKKHTRQIYEYIKSKALSLLLPYTIFGVTQYILWRIYKGNNIAPLLHLFWINTEGLAIAGALWFLTALFLTDVIFVLIDRYIISSIIKKIFIFILAIMGCALPAFNIRLPLGLDVAMVGLGFFYIGVLLRVNLSNRYINNLVNLSWWQIILMITLISVSILMTSPVNLRTGRYGIIPIFWINSMLSIVILINISLKLDKCNLHIINNTLKEIGSNGIIYVCLNQLIITVINEVIKGRIINHILYYPIIIVSVFVCLQTISKIIINTKLKVFVGKKL